MAKKQQKNICINSYIYAIYISINHFKSFVAKQCERSVTETESRRSRRTSNSSYTPAALQINTTKNKVFRFFSFFFPETLPRMYKFASVFQYK